ncbi:MAG: DUF5675 family protein [Actinomycetota bacterium]|nr:DUF5675 family protein [Actinomycetota bacterium]
MKFKLIRTTTGPGGTFGILHHEDGAPFLLTCELPWKDNQAQVSCIPAGVYQVQMQFSPHFQRTLPHVLNVPGREAVEMHAGNTIRDIKGCIALGAQFGILAGLPAVVLSQDALKAFLGNIGGEKEFTLEVVNAWEKAAE